MHLDVQDLKNFYYRSALGRAAQKAISAQVLKMWPVQSGYKMMGYGFANPILRHFYDHSRKIISLMPGPQGALHWPFGQQNQSVLTHEHQWPIDTGFADRLIIMHGLETSEYPSMMLDEALRVLGPGGKALFIVPNRAGFWCRSDKTPFGYGRPYSIGQLEAQLRSQSFIPERHRMALYQLPSHRKNLQRISQFFEGSGKYLPILAGGVIIIEASTRYPPVHKIKKSAKEKAIGLLGGLVEPKPIG